MAVALTTLTMAQMKVAMLRHAFRGTRAQTAGTGAVLGALLAAGTVYLCHPFLVHAAQPHRGTRPRFMAQPPLLPKGEFDPALPPSPVQIAIRRACGLEF